MTAAVAKRRNTAHDEQAKKPVSDRRAYHISELPKDTVAAIKAARVDPRHDYLNSLLDP